MIDAGNLRDRIPSRTHVFAAGCDSRWPVGRGGEKFAPLSILLTLALTAASCTTGAGPGSSSTSGASTGTAPETTTTSMPRIATTTTLVPSSGVGIVFHNGPIHTMDPAVPGPEAVAVSGHRIVAVGGLDDALAAVGPGALTVDLQGRALLPGFIDSHTHRIGDRSSFGYGSAEDAIADALFQGWTSLDELYVNQERLDELLALAEGRQLRLRVNAYLPISNPQGESLGDWYTAYSPGEELSPRLRVAGLKLFPDSNSGRVLHYSTSELTAMVEALHDEGWQLAIKAISIQAHDQVLDALSTVIEGGSNIRRHRIEHALSMNQEQVARMAAMGVIASIQPHYPGALVGDPDIEQLILEQGEESVGRWRDLVDAGVPIASGYAFPNGYDQETLDIPPPGSPLRLLYRAPTMSSGVDNPPPEWMLGHAITVEETLRSLTIGAAYASGTDDRVGSITVGKLADLVVVSGDPLAVSVPELRTLQVVATIVGGKVEYCAPGLETWCPHASAGPQITLTASASRPGYGPELVRDGIAAGESFWSSGEDPPGWLQIDVAAPIVVEAVRFVVYQNPESETVHELEARIDGQWVLVERFTGFTATGDVLEWRPESPTEIEGLRMTTVASASWPEWFEVEIDT